MNDSAQFLYNFLDEFMKIHLLPHPGRKDKISLPSTMTRKVIYEVYKKTLIEIQEEGKFEDCQQLSFSSLKEYLLKYFNAPKKLKDYTDYCDTCFMIKKK